MAREGMQMFFLSYTGYIRLVMYDPQLAIAVIFVYLIEIFAWSLPLMMLSITNNNSFHGGNGYRGDSQIFGLNIATTVLLIMSTVAENLILYLLTIKVRDVDWSKFGDEAIPIHQGGIYKRLFMIEQNAPIFYQISDHDLKHDIEEITKKSKEEENKEKKKNKKKKGEDKARDKIKLKPQSDSPRSLVIAHQVNHQLNQ